MISYSFYLTNLFRYSIKAAFFLKTNFNGGAEEMQGHRLYLLMWFVSSLEAACYSENDAVVYKKASSEGKCTPVVKTFPLFIMLATGRQTFLQPCARGMKRKREGMTAGLTRVPTRGSSRYLLII